VEYGSTLEEDKMTQITSTSAQLVSLVDNHGAVYFHDQTKRAFIQINLGDHKEVFECPSSGLGNWLSHNYYKTCGNVASEAALKAAMRTLAGIATFDGNLRKLNRRVAIHEEDFWYDLCDPKMQAVRIMKNSWEIVSNPPPIFRRSQHQATQVLPASTGDYSLLDKYLNIESDEERLLLHCTVLSYFVPEIAHNVLVVSGSQGSAKSTTVKLIRAIVDPSSTPTLALPSKKDDLVQHLFHHWTPVYDNLSGLTQWQSDMLCSAVTGDSSHKRTLYSNEDESLYAYKPCVILAGINVIPANSDFLDRSVLVTMKRVPNAERLDDSVLQAWFQDDRPRILAGAFDMICKARDIREKIGSGPRLTRMTDSEAWGLAFSEVLGHSRDFYMSAIERNEAQKNSEVVLSNPVADSIANHMAKRETWEGTATELYMILRESPGTCYRSWPNSPHALTRVIKKCLVNLERIGIFIEFSRSATERKIHISRKKFCCIEECSKSNDKPLLHEADLKRTEMTQMTLFNPESISASSG